MPIGGLILSASLGLGACAAPGDGFAPEAQPKLAKALQETLAGKTYTARLASGIGWEMRYEANGRMQMTVSNGTADGGRWHTEDNRLCVDFEGKFPSGCSEVCVPMTSGCTSSVAAPVKWWRWTRRLDDRLAWNHPLRAAAYSPCTLGTFASRSRMRLGPVGVGGQE